MIGSKSSKLSSQQSSSSSSSAVDNVTSSTAPVPMPVAAANNNFLASSSTASGAGGVCASFISPTDPLLDASKQYPSIFEIGDEPIAAADNNHSSSRLGRIVGASSSNSDSGNGTPLASAAPSLGGINGLGSIIGSPHGLLNDTATTTKPSVAASNRMSQSRFGNVLGEPVVLSMIGSGRGGGITDNSTMGTAQGILDMSTGMLDSIKSQQASPNVSATPGSGFNDFYVKSLPASRRNSREFQHLWQELEGFSINDNNGGTTSTDLHSHMAGFEGHPNPHHQMAAAAAVSSGGGSGVFGNGAYNSSSAVNLGTSPKLPQGLLDDDTLSLLHLKHGGDTAGTSAKFLPAPGYMQDNRTATIPASNTNGGLGGLSRHHQQGISVNSNDGIGNGIGLIRNASTPVLNTKNYHRQHIGGGGGLQTSDEQQKPNNGRLESSQAMMHPAHYQSGQPSYIGSSAMTGRNGGSFIGSGTSTPMLNNGGSAFGPMVPPGTYGGIGQPNHLLAGIPPTIPLQQQQQLTHYQGSSVGGANISHGQRKMPLTGQQLPASSAAALSSQRPNGSTQQQPPHLNDSVALASNNPHGYLVQKPSNNNNTNNKSQRRGDASDMNRFSNTSLEDLKGTIFEVSKDQYGCRFLQKKLEEGLDHHIELIFNEVLPHVSTLMTDPFGNYLCQKLLEHCNEEQHTHIITAAASDLVSISVNMHGTRAVQKMVESLSSQVQIDAVIAALKDSVVVLIRDLNGNHVIQKCLCCLSSKNNQFIYDSVASSCTNVATHRHGCCVFQRCIDYASDIQKVQLVKVVIAHALQLVQDPFGNYVVQYVLDLNTADFSEPLIRKFIGHICGLSVQKFSSNVMEKCIRIASPATRHLLVAPMLQRDKLESLVRDSYGNYVVQTALDVADPRQKTDIIDALLPLLPVIRHTPYGKRIYIKLQRDGLVSAVPSAAGSRHASPTLGPSYGNGGSQHMPVSFYPYTHSTTSSSIVPTPSRGTSPLLAANKPSQQRMYVAPPLGHQHQNNNMYYYKAPAGMEASSSDGNAGSRIQSPSYYGSH